LYVFWHLCKKLGGHSCVDSYPSPLFSSTGLHIYFCANAMLFLLLSLCSIVWSQVLWYLQCCSFYSVWPWLFTVFCVSKWTLGWFFNLCDECHCNIDGTGIVHVCRLLLVV
jgi:hypothetical protein